MRELLGLARVRHQLTGIRGAVSGELDGLWDQSTDEPQVAYMARMRFDEVCFRSEELGFPVQRATGEAVLRPGHLSLRNVVSRLGTGTFEVEQLRLAFPSARGPRRFWASGSLRDIPLDRSVRAALPKEAQDTWDRLGVRAGSANATIECSAETDGGPAVTVDAALRDVELLPRAIPYPLPPLTGRVRYDSRRGVLALDDIEGDDGTLRVEADGTVDVASPPSAFRVRVRAEGVPLDAALRGVIGKQLAAAWDTLGIEGGALGADAMAVRQGAEGLRLSGVFEVRELRARPRRFPYPLPPLAGRVRLTPDRRLHIGDLAGRTDHMGVRISGTVDASVEDPVVDLSVVATAVRVDDTLGSSLPQATRDALARAGFRHGSLDIDLALKCPASRPEWVVEAGLEECSAKPHIFPYAVDNLRGTLRWDGQARTLALKSVSGSHGPAQVSVSGQVDLSDPDKPRPRLTIEGTGIHLGQELRAALPKGWLKQWDRHEPSGQVDVALRLAATPDGALVPEGTFALHDCGLLAPELARRIEDVSGTVKLGTHTIELDRMTARAGATRFRGDAVYRTGDKQGRIESLFLTADEVDIDRPLLDALPAELRQALEPHAPAGTLDLRLSYVHGSDRDAPQVRATASLRSVDISAGPDGPRLTGLRGELRSDGQTATLAGARGKLGSAPVELEGRFGLRPGAGDSVVEIRLPRVQIDAAWLRELPRDYRALLEPLAPTGILHGTARLIARDARTPARPAAASLTFENLALNTSPRIHHLHGTATYRAHPTPSSPRGGSLAIQAARARIGDMSIQGLNAECRLSTDALDVPELDWLCYGGRVTGRLRVKLAKPRSYEGELKIAHVDLESLVAAFQEMKNCPTGWLRGTLRLQGTGGDLAGLEVSGICKIDRGRLYDLPLFLSVWNVLALQSPTSGAVTGAHVEFRLRRRLIHIDHFLFLGDAAPVDVTGTIALEPGTRFEDQQIDLLFTVARSRSFLDRLPVIGWVTSPVRRRFARNFLQVKVTGTLADPNIRHLLSPVTKPIGDFMSLAQSPRQRGHRAGPLRLSKWTVPTGPLGRADERGLTRGEALVSILAVT